MVAVLGPVIAVGAEIFKMTLPLLVRQFRYRIMYKKYMKRLELKVDDLIFTRRYVELNIESAVRNLGIITIPVEIWLEKVNSETNRCATLMGLFNDEEASQVRVQCFGSVRYNIGREAFKKIKHVNELIIEGRNFESVSDYPPLDLDEIYLVTPNRLDPIELSPAINQDILLLPSRSFTMNEVIRALKDTDTMLVGIYGMGGVGKTTLMNQEWKQVIEEKIFDVVVMITESDYIDLKKIQVDIANRFGFTRLQELNDGKRRAAKLLERLRREKINVLVILDDFWNSDLYLFTDFGIPCGTNDDGGVFKVAITTGDVAICQRFAAHNSLTLKAKFIEVGVLSKEDSMLLFRHSVGQGEHVDSPSAREIVAECNGLPLALVTLGKAMINKSKFVWESTAFELKNSKSIMLRGISSKVSASIQMSYHHLEDDLHKKCFLFCCLFHKNCRIDIDQLVMYVLSDEMIVADLWTLNEVRRRIQTVLDRLITSCLLLSYTKKSNGIVSSVTMHGMVRDAALNIAREESNGFYASEHPLDWENIRNCSRVSLMKSKIGELPEKPPALPQLLVLSLQQNWWLKRIPDDFFRSMVALVSLDISQTGISSLPSSLSLLVNLLSLCLDYCNFGDTETASLSIVGNLRKLEILSLVDCGLIGLPNEIGRLANLKSLDLSHNYRLIIPPNVISRLYCLEELYTMNSFKQWEAEDKITGHGATLEEVASLISLKTLHLMMENENRALMLCISMGWQASGKYFVQNYHGIADQFECSLKAASPPFGQSIKMLLESVGTLMISECSGLLTVGELATDYGFTEMRTLLVVKCLGMEFLRDFSAKKIPEYTFRVLEKLYLHSLSNLKQITHGPMPEEFFDKLKLMELLECEEMVCLFSPDTLAKFKKLEVLRVENCHELKDGFFLGEGGFENLNVTFPELCEVYLETLPKLEVIWKGVGSTENFRKLKIMEVKFCNVLAYLFTSSMVTALQQLERLEIGDCESMESIVAMEEDVTFPPQIFSNLRELVIQQCHSLKNLYPLTNLSPGGQLPNLQLLEVKDCDKLEVILQVNQDARQTNNKERYVFPQLEQLFLYNLPNLKAICKGTIPRGSFKKLKKFGILNCGNLKELCFPVSLVLYGSLSFLEYISVVGCDSLDAVIYEDDVHAHEKPSQQEILPQLTELILKALPNLEMIVKGVRMTSKSFENLKKVQVEDCNSMKHLLPMSLLGPGGLPKLEHVYLGDCNKMESIFYDDNHGGKKVKSAEKQQLDRLSKLINVHPVDSALQWPNLETVVVKNCGKLTELDWKSPQSETLSQRLLKNSGEASSSGSKDQK